jgi:hypothetical protein
MSDIKQNFEWIKKNGIKYWGKYVALSRGMLLGVSDKYKDLYYPYRHCDDILITRIL